jgi:hypothetical protein
MPILSIKKSAPIERIAPNANPANIAPMLLKIVLFIIPYFCFGKIRAIEFFKIEQNRHDANYVVP